MVSFEIAYFSSAFCVLLTLNGTNMNVFITGSDYIVSVELTKDCIQKCVRVCINYGALSMPLPQEIPHSHPRVRRARGLDVQADGVERPTETTSYG